MHPAPLAVQQVLPLAHPAFGPVHQLYRQARQAPSHRAALLVFPQARLVACPAFGQALLAARTAPQQARPVDLLVLYQVLSAVPISAHLQVPFHPAPPAAGIVARLSFHQALPVAGFQAHLAQSPRLLLLRRIFLVAHLRPTILSRHPHYPHRQLHHSVPGLIAIQRHLLHLAILVRRLKLAKMVPAADLKDILA